jgi:hypothetical protein
MCVCPTGFEGDGITACTNADECSVSISRKRRQAVNGTLNVVEPANCDPTAICIDTEGSYTCVCPSGMEEAPDSNLCQGQ